MRTPGRRATRQRELKFFIDLPLWLLRHPRQLILLGFFVFGMILPTASLRADEAQVQMSAQVVTPTDLFVQVEFSGFTVPYAKAILYDETAKRIYIQQEVGTDGTFNLPFVLDRKKDMEEHFSLYSSYKGLESAHLPFVFKPSAYQIDATKNLVLPPLVDLSKKSVKSNEAVSLLGYACLSCSVEFGMRSDKGDTQTYTATTDSYGLAQYDFVSGIAAGKYFIVATAKRSGVSSLKSTDAILTVTQASSLDGAYGYLPGMLSADALSAFFNTGIGKFILFLLLVMLLSMTMQTLVNLIYLGRWLMALLGKDDDAKKEKQQRRQWQRGIPLRWLKSIKQRTHLFATKMTKQHSKFTFEPVAWPGDRKQVAPVVQQVSALQHVVMQRGEALTHPVEVSMIRSDWEKFPWEKQAAPATVKIAKSNFRLRKK